jgi:hypothetical protein
MAGIQTGVDRKGHFSDEDLVDFARRQGSAYETARVARHLDTGCERCTPTLHFWKGVVGLAGQEPSYRPPDGTVGQARAEFALRRPEGLLGRVAGKASLVFDSFRQPLPAGVRAAGPSPRQVLYKAGRYLIMLRVEPSAGSDRLSVVGQILDEVHPTRAVENVAVLVLNGDETVERTLTNRLGEFELEPDPAESLRISVGVPEIGSVNVPWPMAGPKATGKAGQEGARKPGRKPGRTMKARQP